MTSYVSPELRRQIREQAQNCCEYCFLFDDNDYARHEVDHIYAEKHGGLTAIENLCLSCANCNRFKGSDLCSLDPITGDVTSLYHPRHHQWNEHFRLKEALIEPISPSGRATVRILRLNEILRLTDRVALFRRGLYPRRLD